MSHVCVVYKISLMLDLFTIYLANKDEPLVTKICIKCYLTSLVLTENHFTPKVPNISEYSVDSNIKQVLHSSKIMKEIIC